MEIDLYNLDDLTATSKPVNPDVHYKIDTKSLFPTKLKYHHQHNRNNKSINNLMSASAEQQGVDAYYGNNPAKLKEELAKKQKLVANTLQNRFEKMQAEEIKLKQIKKALSTLDADTSKEIHVLRGKIEYTQSQLTQNEEKLKIKKRELEQLNEAVNGLR